MSRYSSVVEDHLLNPRCVGPLARADASVIVDNEACGDQLELEVELDGERIIRAAFRAKGCPPAIAAGSLLAERLCGQKLTEAAGWDVESLITALGGLPRGKRHAAVLACDALRQLLDQVKLTELHDP
jgi:NifU-like protein involved in Fe-S cluster formation